MSHKIHEHDRIGDVALDSALRVLRPPDVEEMSPKQKEIKEEPYHLPNRLSRNQNILKRHPFYRIDGDDVGESAQSESITAQL